MPFWVRSWCVGTVLVAVLVCAPAASGQDGDIESQLQEATRLGDASDWDKAIAILNRIIELLARGAPTPELRRLLISAYQQRAVADLQVGAQDKARADFGALLLLAPDHVLTGPSAAYSELFERVRTSTLAQLQLAVRPGDAVVALEPLSGGTQAVLNAAEISSRVQWVAPGSYRLVVRRPGYEPYSREFEAASGRKQSMPVELTRVSAALFIRTVPPDVRVLIDDDVRGTTEAGADVNGASQVLVIDGLPPRAAPYRIRFEKECFVPVAESFTVETIDPGDRGAAGDPSRPSLDHSFDDVSLRRSFGSVMVRADQPGAVVYIDGERRGAASEPITDICDGEHVVDVRAPNGRFSAPVTVSLDKVTAVDARLRPAYAVMVDSSRADGALSAPDVTRAIGALRARNILLLPSGAGAGGSAGQPARWDSRLSGEQADALMRQLDVQGLAALTRVTGGDRVDTELRLLARGSHRPDVVRWASADAASIQSAIDSLDAEPPLLRPDIGIDAIDVLRQSGAVVAQVDPDGPSKGTIAAGDVIVGVGATLVSNVAELRKLLASASGQTVNLQFREKSGFTAVRVESVPVIMSREDQRLFNVVASVFRARLAQRGMTGPSAAGDVAEIAMRLNLSVALLAIETWDEAAQTLAPLQIRAGRGVSRGTVDFIRGTALARLGRVAEARGLLERASQDKEATLTWDGAYVAYLAAQELEELQPRTDTGAAGATGIKPN